MEGKRSKKTIMKILTSFGYCLVRTSYGNMCVPKFFERRPCSKFQVEVWPINGAVPGGGGGTDWTNPKAAENLT